MVDGACQVRTSLGPRRLRQVQASQQVPILGLLELNVLSLHRRGGRTSGPHLIAPHATSLAQPLSHTIDLFGDSVAEVTHRSLRHCASNSYFSTSLLVIVSNTLKRTARRVLLTASVRADKPMMIVLLSICHVIVAWGALLIRSDIFKLEVVT